MRRRFKRSSRCPTHKVRYRDDREAGKALKRFAANRAEHDNAHAETRAYPCPFCHGWHLTSRPDRKAT